MLSSSLLALLDALLALLGYATAALASLRAALRARSAEGAPRHHTMSKSGRWELDTDDGSRLHLLGSFGAWGRAEGNLDAPRFLLPIAGGVLVADSGNDRLQIFSAAGESVRTIYGSKYGHPAGLATDGTHVWVADSSNCSVSKISLRDGVHLSRLGAYGAGRGHFSGPEGLALARGVLFVADEGNCRVVMLDAASLDWLGEFGSRGTGPGQLLNPVGLTAIDNGDRLELYVRDTQNHRIQVFDVTGANQAGVCGAFVRAFGEHGTAPGQFVQPTGMTTDGRGRILVAEKGTARVQVLTMEGAPLQVLPLPRAKQLYGMCVSGERVFVADYGRHEVHMLALVPARERWVSSTEVAR